MYVKRNIAARSRNHFALETTIYSLYVVELHVAVHYIKNIAHCTTKFYGKFMSPTKMQMQIVLYCTYYK
jgi:hypothetical protein